MKKDTIKIIVALVVGVLLFILAERFAVLTSLAPKAGALEVFYGCSSFVAYCGAIMLVIFAGASALSDLEQ